MAFKPISGDINVTASINDLNIFKPLYQANADVDIDGALNYNTHIVIDSNMSKINLDGNLDVRKLTIKSAIMSDQPDPLDLQVNYNLGIKPTEKTVSVTEFDVTANDGSNDILTCSLSEALTLSFMQNTSEMHQPVKLNVGINQFKNALIADLLPKFENINLHKSLTSSKLELTIFNGGRSIQGVGSLNIIDLIYRR